MPHGCFIGKRRHCVRARWNRLPAAGGQAARDERALAYARRALAPLPQARVAAARSEWDAQNSRLAVRVTLDLGGEQAGLEVRI